MWVMVSADMEGATSLTWSGAVEPGTEQWQRFRRMFTGAEIAAIASGAVEGSYG
jgi:D-amino peptidase